EPGTALFTLEQDFESEALGEAQAREERAAAVQRDLRKGQRPDELAAARAALLAAQAALKQSASDLARQRGLATQGFISGANLDALVARRDADAARVRQLEAELRVARLGARADAQTAAGVDTRAAAQVVAQNRWRLQQRSVQAPAAARVEDTLYRPGEWVAAGAPVVNLLEPGAVKLRFFVPEARLSQFPVGTTVSVGCDGCGQRLSATVRHVAQQAEYTPPVIYSQDNRSRLVFLVEAWPAPSDAVRLHPGQPVDVQRMAAP
ncbi:MAG TPA: HlyD family efflux transporter periplasmic adaptor subunit, partial [Burkholderiaceae bacterium]|nr:HlyD family efflux transporter periplasmic adaptor subunit [Burkholderiaceae bacterium]